jgi:hypothetical protein
MDIRPLPGAIPFAPDPSGNEAPEAGGAPAGPSPAAPGEPPVRGFGLPTGAGSEADKMNLRLGNLASGLPGAHPLPEPSAQRLDARLETAQMKRELLDRAAGLVAGLETPSPPGAASTEAPGGAPAGPSPAAPGEPAVRGFGLPTGAGPEADEMNLRLGNVASGLPGVRADE